MHRQLCHSLLTVLFLFVVADVRGQDDEEFKPGLQARYWQNDESDIRRIDPDLNFHWDAAPHQHLQPGPFTAAWTGQLLIRDVVPYRFHVELQGKLMLTVGEEVIFQTESAERRWLSSPPIKLSPGFQRVDVTFAALGKESTLKLFWSTELFELEPIPAHLLFHETESTEVPQLQRGEDLFAAYRCQACHQRGETEPPLSAPALWGVTKGLNPAWLVDKLLSKHAEAQHAKMPDFGLTQQEAEAIAAYLQRLDAPFVLESVPTVNKKATSGAELFHSLGCLACHEADEMGKSGAFGGGSLTRIGEKRSPEWLATWLHRPERMNPQHRMPVFELTASERGALVEYLSSRVGPQAEAVEFELHERPRGELADQGRELIKRYRCANCHKIPAIEVDTTGCPDLSQPVKDWSKSCLADEVAASPDTQAEPAFRPVYPQADRAALRAYVESQFNTPRTTPAEVTRGAHVLRDRNCLACHQRGTEQGIVAVAGEVSQTFKELSGQSPSLIPPSLTAVGDKLNDAVFQDAIQGKHERVRADWMRIRMPRFRHSAEDLQALQAYFVEHDRIPVDGVPELPKVTLSGDDLFLMGRLLVGAGGFSCIACHRVGDYVPKNAALGTRGANLLNIQQRLRPEFYHRWCRAPLRVVPGMEMPSYQKPVANVLDNDVQLQLATLWEALGNKDFEPPTNPLQVEQLWQVTEDAEPRIIRDVFTVSEANGGGAVARAFAIGFPNQHSLLFDLDTLRIREWRYGDFARQRTQGKSWYWDLAGVEIGTESNPTQFVLVHPQGYWIKLEDVVPKGVNRPAKLRSYQQHGNKIELKYDIEAKVAGKLTTIEITETYQPDEYEGRTGWQRELDWRGLPSEYRLQYGRTPFDKLAFDGIVGQSSPHHQRLLANVHTPQVPLPDRPVVSTLDREVTTLPGYVGRPLPFPQAIMATSLNWDAKGRLVFTSLKGDVFRADDTNGDGIEDELVQLEEGLSAPFGILADGKDLLVTHKPELLRLQLNEQGDVTGREVVADGWGFTDNYHDWVNGPVRDQQNNLYVSISSDYSQPERNPAHTKWRGKVLKIDTSGSVTPIAHELRYPIGIAVDAEDRLFVSDQQGVQNTQNEINHILPDHYYGVPARADEEHPERETRASVQIPHPLTRSVNGIFFLPADHASPFAGHGIGCEYNGKFLIRFTYHEVDGALQGATYLFTRNNFTDEQQAFLGPICGGVAPNGDIYVGSIFDSGWLGGPNVGEIVKLTRQGEFPNGIREVRATATGFDVDFIHPVTKEFATNPENFSLTGSTWVWKGSYGTDPSGVYSPEISGCRMSDDRRTVSLSVAGLREKYVYELNVTPPAGEEMFPTFAAYSMNRLVPE